MTSSEFIRLDFFRVKLFYLCFRKRYKLENENYEIYVHDYEYEIDEKSFRNEKSTTQNASIESPDYSNLILAISFIAIIIAFLAIYFAKKRLYIFDRCEQNDPANKMKNCSDQIIKPKLMYEVGERQTSKQNVENV